MRICLSNHDLFSSDSDADNWIHVTLNFVSTAMVALNFCDSNFKGKVHDNKQNH
jgi:hypothetical protein